MRINVYSQELTSEVGTVEKTSNTGLVYSAVQLMLHSSPMLHHPPQDDDRSAVTFWLPKSKERREELWRKHLRRWPRRYGQRVLKPVWTEHPRCLPSPR